MTTKNVADAVKSARTGGRLLRIAGTGNWLNAGHPVESDCELRLREDSGIVEYVPEDLTITVRAGTTLLEIDAITTAQGQWLPLDPPGKTSGTIGATIATASSGPLAHSFGLARDLLLGAEFVTGRGETVRGGGRVVKNVAGFDLLRLMCGAWGTLGVITEVTLRLYALPEAELTVAVWTGESARELGEFADGLRASPVTPFAAELLDREASRQIGLGDAPAALIRLGGNRAVVKAQRDAIATIARCEDVTPVVWTDLRQLDENATSVTRFAGPPARLADTWIAAVSSAREIEKPLMHASINRGIVRVIARKGATAEPDSSSASACASVIREIAPPAVWHSESKGAVADPQSRKLLAAFDPDRILNRGILGL